MKIISLISAGLAASERNMNDGSMYPDYTCIVVGRPYMGDWYNASTLKEIHNDDDVVEIRLVPCGDVVMFKEMMSAMPAPEHDQYHVKLKNGHIMVLPADKYIAEYAPDEEEN